MRKIGAQEFAKIEKYFVVCRYVTKVIIDAKEFGSQNFNFPEKIKHPQRATAQRDKAVIVRKVFQNLCFI
jgi:hypothetical protein